MHYLSVGIALEKVRRLAGLHQETLLERGLSGVGMVDPA